MRLPRRSYSSAVGYSTRKDWPTSSSRDQPNISHSWALQSTMARLRETHRPTGASSKASR